MPLSVSAGAGYTGQPAVIGDYDGSLGNVHVEVTALTPGDADTATFSVSFDGGATVDNNGGAGYTLAELNTVGPLANVGVQLRLPGTSAFNANDVVNMTLIQSDHEDVFALFDELELALREFDDLATVGAVDYDGNGIFLMLKTSSMRSKRLLMKIHQLRQSNPKPSHGC